MKDPLKMEMPSFRLDSLRSSMKEGLKRPPVGVTQGGSSRKDAGCRAAAKVSKVKQPQGNLYGR